MTRRSQAKKGQQRKHPVHFCSIQLQKVTKKTLQTLPPGKMTNRCRSDSSIIGYWINLQYFIFLVSFFRLSWFETVRSHLPCAKPWSRFERFQSMRSLSRRLSMIYNARTGLTRLRRYAIAVNSASRKSGELENLFPGPPPTTALYVHWLGFTTFP